jgi:hypothetical protein
MTSFNGTFNLKAKKINLPNENGHWVFHEKMGDKNYVGFIYVIFDAYLRKAYLGKKNFRVGKGSKKGQESNWKSYISSSKYVKLMLENRPRDEFEFIVLDQYKTKGTLSYSETWSLCYVEAPTTDNWYNVLIEKVSWPIKEKISERHKEKLDEIIRRLNG